MLRPGLNSVRFHKGSLCKPNSLFLNSRIGGTFEEIHYIVFHLLFPILYGLDAYVRRYTMYEVMFRVPVIYR